MRVEGAPNSQYLPSAEAGKAVPTGSPGAAKPSASRERTDAPSQDEKLDLVAKMMNEAMDLFHHSIEFEVVRGHRVVIRVIDTQSHQVIQEIPPQKLLDAYQELEKTLGLLLDKKA